MLAPLESTGTTPPPTLRLLGASGKASRRQAIEGHQIGGRTGS